MPGSGLTLGLAIAALAALATLAPIKKIGPILGWVAAVSLIALFGAALFALASEPGRGLSGIGRALTDAYYGAPESGAFSGALAGEIAMAAMLHLLPPLVAPTGVAGAWHAEARARTTRAQSLGAMLGALGYALLTTFVGLSLIATNAFATPTEGSRSVDEVRFYRTSFDTVSQREEASRFFSGIIRVQEGETGVVEIHAGTERGMILAPSFEDGGEAADVMLRVSDGRVVEIQRPGTMGALEVAPDSAFDEVTIHGRMLPRGGALIAASMTEGGGSVVSRVALAALLLLALLGAVGWGLGVRRTLGARLPDKSARFTAIVPALGLALAAAGVLRGFEGIGLIAAGLLASVAAIGLIVRAKEIGQLLRTSRPAKKAPAPARKPKAEPAKPAAKKKRKRKKKA